LAAVKKVTEDGVQLGALRFLNRRLPAPPGEPDQRLPREDPLRVHLDLLIDQLGQLEPGSVRLAADWPPPGWAGPCRWWRPGSI
jgi:hypothetical protein